MANKTIGALAQQFSNTVKAYISSLPLLSSGIAGAISNNSGTTKTAQASVTDPTVSGDYLVFNGSSNGLYYSRNNASSQTVWTYTSPFSIEWDMKVGAQNGNKTIMSFGHPDTNSPYGELIVAFDIRGIGCYFQAASGGLPSHPFNFQWFANGSNGATATTPNWPTVNQNYKYGLMLFTVNGLTYIRGYLDGIQRFQAPMVLNYTASTYGLSIGGAAVDVTFPGSRFAGQIANLRLDDSLFWTTQNRSGAVYEIMNGFQENYTGLTQTTGDTAPGYSAGAMTFNGSQRIRYPDGAVWRVGPPYSVEFEFSTTAPGTNQQIFNIGGDLSATFPEIEFRILSGQLVFRSSKAGTGVGSDIVSSTVLPSITANTFYKIGCMFYTLSGQTRLRLLVNDAQVSDSLYNATQPYDSVKGLGIGICAGTTLLEPFSGSIKSLSVGKSLFWTV